MPLKLFKFLENFKDIYWQFIKPIKYNWIKK